MSGARSYRGHLKLPRTPTDHGGYVPRHAHLAKRRPYHTRLFGWTTTVRRRTPILRRWRVSFDCCCRGACITIATTGLPESLFEKLTASAAEPHLKALQELFINFWGACSRSVSCIPLTDKACSRRIASLRAQTTRVFLQHLQSPTQRRGL